MKCLVPKFFLFLNLLIVIVALPRSMPAQLPGDFPGITTEVSGETGEGYVFLAVATKVEGIGYYLIILDNNGTVIDYKKLENDYAYDFKMQPNGQLSYAQFLSHHDYTGGGNAIHMLMDQEMNVVDSVQLTNGYIAEAHDFQALPNGHFLAFGYYLTPGVDMSRYVEGGHPAAFVSGGVVQELDADKNVVWQWRSWDHYGFDEYHFRGRRATRETVSAFHLNTIGLDFDGHLLLATPSWVKKINRQTGKTIWDLGGEDNDYSFEGVDSMEAVDHFEGHAIYLLENGNYLTYDNGGRFREDASSEVHEYSLDQDAMVATHVWTYARENDTIAAWHRGNAYRLPNGNTIIGWGGASGDPIPTATEVDPEGNVVFEAFFDNPEVESYRAFRFPLNAGIPDFRDEKESVAAGDYEFIQGDTLHTGISIHIDNRTGDGYNTLSISRYHQAPTYPTFPGRAPLVKVERVVMEASGITAIDGQIMFDADAFNIGNPEDITISHREFEGQGLFIPLTTSYNPVKGIVAAEFDRLGEFIITWPDIDPLLLPATPVSPHMGEGVNQEYPVRMEWAPDGFFTGFNLQVATDEAFSTLVTDTVLSHATVFELAEPSENTTYYWRVKTRNGMEESAWSDTARFMTTPPSITVNVPNEAEEWQVGLDYWILWDDNLTGDVIVELHRADALLSVIDTTVSRGAIQWSIPADHETGEDFSIVIKSLENASVLDASDAYFSLIDTVTSVDEGMSISSGSLELYPNPASDLFTVIYNLKETSPVTISLFDMTGRMIESTFEGKQGPGRHRLRFAPDLQSGNMYIVELRAGSTVMRRTLMWTD